MKHVGNMKYEEHIPQAGPFPYYLSILLRIFHIIKKKDICLNVLIWILASNNR